MIKTLNVSVGQHSDAGRKSINQDFHGVMIPDDSYLSSKGIAIALADGISSSGVSQVASETAVKSFLDDYYSTSEAWSVRNSVLCVMRATNSWLYAQSQNGPNRFDKDQGYICTFSAMVLKSNTAHVFHSGDSRVYRVLEDNLEQLTHDHRRVVSADTSYLTRALGVNDTLELDYQDIALGEGDTFFIATDGVFEFLDSRTMAQAINNASDLDDAARWLVSEAYAAGSDDNMTIQIVRVKQLPEKNSNEMQQLATALPVPPTLSPRMIFDGYKIIRDIYISSRSHVYLAEDTGTGETVALKTPSAEMRADQQRLENFMMEDWIVRRLSNPYVLKAHTSPRARNYLYIVSEYCDGQSLAQWMADRPLPGIEKVREIIDQIAKGLQALHRQEMVHQDIRPNNIMIDQSGTIKIIDFGATKVAGVSEIFQWNEGLVGTAQFTAPEYFLGLPGTSQSDIFSLGVVTYIMLSGKLPYGNAISQVGNNRSMGRLRYRSLNEAESIVPDWVDCAISKAVRIDPMMRYSEVSEFVHELSRPSADYIRRAKPPLIERNPVLFWQCISIALLGIVIYQMA